MQCHSSTPSFGIPLTEMDHLVFEVYTGLQTQLSNGVSEVLGKPASSDDDDKQPVETSNTVEMRRVIFWTRT